MEKANAEELKKAMGAVLDLVLGVVVDAGRKGVPGGILYAALMEHGCTKTQFDAIMDILMEAGRIEQRGHVYYSATLERDEALETSSGKNLSSKVEG